MSRTHSQLTLSRSRVSSSQFHKPHRTLGRLLSDWFPKSSSTVPNRILQDQKTCIRIERKDLIYMLLKNITWSIYLKYICQQLTLFACFNLISTLLEKKISFFNTSDSQNQHEVLEAFLVSEPQSLIQETYIVHCNINI